MASFNPRAHVGRDIIINKISVMLCSFNPRVHVGRDLLVLFLKSSFTCFNPRAHVGRDKSDIDVNKSVSVSIHAPTWGATSG